jgi:hypothetical protein
VAEPENSRENIKTFPILINQPHPSRGSSQKNHQYRKDMLLMAKQNPGPISYQLFGAFYGAYAG